MNIEKYDWLNDIYNQINFNNLPHGIIINGPSGIAFFKKVRSGYLDLSQNEPNRIKVLDAKKSIDDLHKDIVSFVDVIL
jgi:hypothetical protein